MNMRILMIARETMYSSPGGDTIQIVSTAKYLRLLGVSVDIKLASEKIDHSNYDLIHFFNIIRPDDILPHIRVTDLPFVVSTIFVDYSEYEQKNRTGVFGLLTKIFNGDQVEYIKSIARFIKNGDKIKSNFYLLRGQSASIRKIAKMAAMLLPNSHSEYDRFVRRYKIKSKYRKVPNAIDPETFNNNIEPDDQFKDHVICVGRIEGRKNQLNLIKALLGTDLKLTLIGKPSPNHMSYYEMCRELIAGNSNMRIIEHIEQSELAKIYLAARVHVLPSWFETTGLSSLEAAMMDCNLVVSKKGDTEEYFQDMVNYCDPEDTLSIKNAVLSSYNSPLNTRLKLVIIQEYTWQNAAEKTLVAYQEVLNS